MNTLRTASFCFLVFLSACRLRTDVFEKDIAIPKQSWQSSFKPEITVSIKDTVALYNLYLVIRHSDAYNFNNIWINLSVWEPGAKEARSRRFDLPLASNDKGWYGRAMDDIYETRILLQPETRFTKLGDYRFAIEQVMREDPLNHVLDVGLRIEKAISTGQ